MRRSFTCEIWHTHSQRQRSTSILFQDDSHWKWKYWFMTGCVAQSQIHCNDVLLTDNHSLLLVVVQSWLNQKLRKQICWFILIWAEETTPAFLRILALLRSSPSSSSSRPQSLSTSASMPLCTVILQSRGDRSYAAYIKETMYTVWCVWSILYLYLKLVTLSCPTCPVRLTKLLQDHVEKVMFWLFPILLYS